MFTQEELKEGLLFDRLEALFLDIKKQTGTKKQRILLEAGIDPALYRAYKRVNRVLPDDILERLGRSELVPVAVERLKAWKVIDKFGVSVLLEAIHVLKEEDLLSGAMPCQTTASL